MGRSGRLGRFTHQGSIRSTTFFLAAHCHRDPALGGELRAPKAAGGECLQPGRRQSCRMAVSVAGRAQRGVGRGARHSIDDSGHS